jgi:hypothetical protein
VATIMSMKLRASSLASGSYIATVIHVVMRHSIGVSDLYHLHTALLHSASTECSARGNNGREA